MQVHRRLVLEQTHIIELNHASVHVAHGTLGDRTVNLLFAVTEKSVPHQRIFLNQVVTVPPICPVSLRIFALQRLQDRMRLVLLAQHLVVLESFEVA